jgi:hypothetical protein
MVPKDALFDITPWIKAMIESDDPREFYYDEFYIAVFECDYLTDGQKIARLKTMLAVLANMMAAR